jgi:flagellar biosynthesis protein FliQ
MGSIENLLKCVEYFTVECMEQTTPFLPSLFRFLFLTSELFLGSGWMLSNISTYNNSFCFSC